MPYDLDSLGRPGESGLLSSGAVWNPESVGEGWIGVGGSRGRRGVGWDCCFIGGGREGRGGGGLESGLPLLGGGGGEDIREEE